MTRRFLLGCALLLASGLVGCDSKPKPVPVSGTVELDGKPLEDGRITFVGETGTTPEVFDVKQGKFQGEAIPGKKRVEIRAFKTGKPTKMGTETIEATPENYIPSAYNTESKITADVTAGGVNPSKFEAKSAK